MCFISVVQSSVCLFHVRGDEKKKNDNKHKIRSIFIGFWMELFFFSVFKIEHKSETKNRTNERKTQWKIRSIYELKRRRAKSIHTARPVNKLQRHKEEAVWHTHTHDANHTFQPSIFIRQPAHTRSIRSFSRFAWILSQTYGTRSHQSVSRRFWTIVRYTRSSPGKCDISIGTSEIAAKFCFE